MASPHLGAQGRRLVGGLRAPYGHPGSAGDGAELAQTRSSDVLAGGRRAERGDADSGDPFSDRPELDRALLLAMMSAPDPPGRVSRGLSRLGYRLMAWSFAFTRRGPRMRESLVASGVAPGETILDYACGPGHFTIEAARMVGPSGHVHAIDREPLAIEMVRRRARDAGVTNVTAAVSACPTGLADHSVDRVLLYDAIAGIDDKRAVLAELDRVLVPDGVLSIWVEHGPPEATVPLITANSRFVLRERIGDILDFGRREAEPDPGTGSTA